jgi:hypothetical protein
VGSNAEIEDLRRVADGGFGFSAAGLSFDLKHYTLPGLKNERTLVVVSRSECAS